MYHVQITKTLPVGHRKIMSEDLVSGQVPQLDRAETVSTMSCLQNGSEAFAISNTTSLRSQNKTKLLAYAARIKQTI